jgi:hypothetical protein
MLMFAVFIIVEKGSIQVTENHSQNYSHPTQYRMSELKTRFARKDYQRNAGGIGMAANHAPAFQLRLVA